MSSPTDGQQKPKSNLASDYVKLNVGGMPFYTTISILTKLKDNRLTAMFTGQMDKKIDHKGWVIIERNGKHFGTILNFLRDGTVSLPNQKKDLNEIRSEATFYCISELIELCDKALTSLENTST